MAERGWDGAPIQIRPTLSKSYVKVTLKPTQKRCKMKKSKKNWCDEFDCKIGQK